MLISLLSTAMIVMLLAFIRTRYICTKSWIEPGIIFAVNLLLLYPVRGMVIYIFGQDSLPDYLGVDTEENLEETSWVALLGVVGYVVGYMVLIGRRSFSILSGRGVKETPSTLAVCTTYFIVALIGITYKIATNDYMSYLIGEERIGALTQFSNLFTAMQWPALIGVWVLLYSGARSTKFWMIFYLVNLVVVPYQFVQGSKTFLSLLLVSVLIASYWVKRKLPGIYILISITLVTTFVFPFVQSFREYVNESYGRIPSLAELAGSVDRLRTIEQRTEIENRANAVITVSARYGGIDHLYGVRTVVPTLIDYKYGRDYAAIIVNLVPRMIWPEKPSYSRGAEYGASGGHITSVTPFPIGEAYWDFGVMGVPFMMAIWGGLLALILRLSEKIYRNSDLAFFFSLFFLSQLYWMTGSETSMPMVLAGLPQQAAVLAVIYIAKQLLTKTRFAPVKS
jgi:hypothetical protein